MPIDDLRDIVTRATWLWERLDLLPAEAPPAPRTKEAARRLAAWVESVGGVDCTDPAALERRLRWGGIDVARAHAALGPFVLPPGAPLPGWASTLAEIVAEAKHARSSVAAPPTPGDPRDTGEPLPFEELLVPMVRVARRRLDTALAEAQEKDAASFFSAEAHRALDRSLLVALAGLSELALYEMFCEARTPGALLLARSGLLAAEDPSREAYATFVATSLDDGLGVVFRRFPVLARLVCTTVEQWVSATTELVTRTAKDRDTIAEKLGKTRSEVAGRVVAVETSIADAHGGGRSVAILRFESGLRVVYKPRSLALDRAYATLLGWCNRLSGRDDFKIVEVIDRGSHGFAEHVAQLPCADEAAARRFYHRAGQLTCLLHVLRASDCHNENMIACGEHPTLIDMEALLHATPRTLDRTEGDTTDEGTTAERSFWESSIRTGMLPRWSFSNEGRLSADHSALGGVYEERVVKRPGWAMPGTDAMHPVELVETEAPGKNAPRIGDRWLSPDAHIDDVVAGFASFYDFLLEHRDALLTDSPLLLLRGQAVRFVFRATRTYAAIGKRLREPQFLGDGVDYTIELDQLSRPFACTENKPNAWPLLDAELRAMERLDVPLFLTDTSSVDVVVPGSAPSRGYLLEASFDAVVQKLRGLGPNDRERQIAVVEGSLVARAADARASGAVETESPRAVEPRAEIEPLAAALRIAEDLGRRAHHDDDGTPAWLGFGFVASANRYQLDLLGDRLYDGRLGVALFFGALARVTGEASYATRARACLGPVLGWVRDAKHPMHVHAAAKTGLGAATGLGGIVYVLATLAELVGDPTLLDDAAEVARLVTQPAIDADRTYDIFGGAAGAIFGLVKLHRARPDPALLARIAACADHLVDRKVPRPEGGVAWHVEGGPALTGMSHGAAGIALALARAYAATGDTRYRDNALEAIAFETRHYSAEAQNWPDFRAGEHGASCLVQWCHGAAGIALARVATRTALDDAALDADIDAALKTTLAHPLPALDHLCCGSMGLVETLLVGAEHGYGEQLRAAARQKAQTVLARAEADGGHRLFANMPTSIFNPALFSGTAGIGYQLLRLVSSDVPSVLVWG